MKKILRAGVATLLAGSLLGAAPAATAFASPSKDAQIQTTADKQSPDGSSDTRKHDAAQDRRLGEKADAKKDAREGSGSRDGSRDTGGDTSKR